MLEGLRNASFAEAGGIFLVSNLLIFGGSILLCWLLGFAFKNRRIFDRWEPLRRVEVGAAIGTVFLNSAVSVIGWWLWTRDLIVLEASSVGRSVFDAMVMILAMDLGMYVFHRIAHVRWLYPLMHRFHHRHEATNPISLFVFHPIEVLGFGGLMIFFLAVYPMTFAGLIAYLTLNVLFGTLGHSGVEPFPALVNRLPLIRWVGTSTFHAEHHEHPRYNFGFYTLLWDRLFGTLDPEYDRRFAGEGRTD